MILYTKDTCEPCQRLKAKLNAVGEQYLEIKVTDTNKESLQKRGLKIVPCIDVHNTLIQGTENILYYLNIN